MSLFLGGILTFRLSRVAPKGRVQRWKFGCILLRPWQRLWQQSLAGALDLGRPHDLLARPWPLAFHPRQALPNLRARLSPFLLNILFFFASNNLYIVSHAGHFPIQVTSLSANPPLTGIPRRRDVLLERQQLPGAHASPRLLDE